MTVAQIKERVPQLDVEIAKARTELRRAQIADAAAHFDGKTGADTAKVRADLQNLKDLRDGVAMLGCRTELEETTHELAHREPKHKRDVERVAALKEKAAGFRGESGGTGSAWRSAERTRADAANDAFSEYETANNAHSAEARAIDELVEKRSELQAQLDEALGS